MLLTTEASLQLQSWVSFGSLCTDIYVFLGSRGSRGQTQDCFSGFPTLFFDTGSLINLVLGMLGWAGHPGLSRHPSLCLLSTGITAVCPQAQLYYMWVLGDGTHGLVLAKTSSLLTELCLQPLPLFEI